MKTIVVPDRNKKDLDEIPKVLRRKLNWVIAENMSDVLKVALLDRENDASQAHRPSSAKLKSKLSKKRSLKRERAIRKNQRERAIPLRP
jgi:ATP-dependent Lon protease